MKSMLIAAAALAAMTMAGAANAATAEDATKGGCMTCHAVDTKKMGPSFKDVAAKYKGKADAQATITKKLADGAGHPKVKPTGAELDGIVKWVLSN
jgi:cytochrome c